VDEKWKAWRFRSRTPASALRQASRTAQEAYGALMKERVAPALRSLGCKGSGGRFTLPSDAYWCLIGFQKSAYSDATEVQVTVNLSAIPRQVWQEQRGREPHLPEKPSPSTFYGAWAAQTRIGRLLPGGQDKWWRVLADDENAAVADDILATMEAYGLPWLREQMHG
jgi:Domain of unknown function (DUF4304)